MTTPNETHLRAALAYRKELEALTKRMFSGQEPDRTDAERDALVDSIFIKHAFPASPATTSGTPSDAELVAMLGTEADFLKFTDNAPRAERYIRKAAARITALSAQVAELERDKAAITKELNHLRALPEITEMNRLKSDNDALRAAMNHQGPK